MPTCDVTVTTDALAGTSTLADSLRPLTICRRRCVCRSRVCRGSRSPPRGPYLALSHHAHPGHHHALAEACLLKACGGGDTEDALTSQTQQTRQHVENSPPSLFAPTHLSTENSPTPSDLSSAGFSKRRSRGGLRSGLLSPGRPSPCPP